MTKPRLALGLIRLSTEEQAQEGKGGILRQRADIAAAARLHGLTVVRTLEAIGLSGTKVIGSPVFRELFRELASVDGVIVSAIDRLVRPNQLGDLAVFDPFQQQGKKIWTPAGETDLCTDSGFMSSAFTGVMAGLERRMLLARTLAGKEALRRQGRHVIGPQSLPRGIAFDKARGIWSYQEPYYSRIRQAYELLFRGESWETIAETVGGGWSAVGLRRTLLNPVWKGLRVYPTGKHRDAPLEIRLPLEPLLSPERWRQAQELILARHTHWRQRLRGKSLFLATGLLRCRCGKAWYVKPDYRPGQHDTYYCSSRYRGGKGCGAARHSRETIDALIERIVSGYLLRPGVLRKVLETVAQGETTNGNEEARLAKLEARRKRLTDLAIDGLVTKQDFAERLRAIDRERQEIMGQRYETAPTLPAKTLARLIASAFAEFAHLSLEDKRSLLRRAVREIRIENDAIPTLTLSGGFLGQITHDKLEPHSRLPYWRRYQGRAKQSLQASMPGFATGAVSHEGFLGQARFILKHNPEPNSR